MAKRTVGRKPDAELAPRATTERSGGRPDLHWRPRSRHRSRTAAAGLGRPNPTAARRAYQAIRGGGRVHLSCLFPPSKLRASVSVARTSRRSSSARAQTTRELSSRQQFPSSALDGCVAARRVRGSPGANRVDQRAISCPPDPARPPYDPCWHFRGHRHRRSNGATGRLGTSRWAQGYWAVSIGCPVRFSGRRPSSDRQNASQRRRGRVRQSGMPDPWQASKPPRRLFSETSPTPRKSRGSWGRRTTGDSLDVAEVG